MHVKTLPLGQLVGIKSPCIAPLYPGWGIVGLNIDRCIKAAVENPLLCKKVTQSSYSINIEATEKEVLSQLHLVS